MAKNHPACVAAMCGQRECRDGPCYARVVPMPQDERPRKWCPKGKHRPFVEDFAPDPTRSDGRSGWCRACRATNERRKRATRRPLVPVQYDNRRLAQGFSEAIDWTDGTDAGDR